MRIHMLRCNQDRTSNVGFSQLGLDPPMSVNFRILYYVMRLLVRELRSKGLVSWIYVAISYGQLIGSREKLEENPIFHGKIYGFL